MKGNDGGAGGPPTAQPELRGLKVERTRHINRIKGLLVSYGIRMGVGRDFLDQLETDRLLDGTPIPVGLKRRFPRVGIVELV